MATRRDAALTDLSLLIQDYARFQQLRRRDKICRHAITLSQCYALEAVVAAESLSVTALADVLGLNKSSASRVAESLATLGLATVRCPANNARTKLVAATTAGAALARRIHREIEVEHGRLLRDFSEAEIEVCRRLMRSLQRKDSPTC
jgi:MarR family transcriptional regulator, 2-MHQ and catechol-resistance regulon repressor